MSEEQVEKRRRPRLLWALLAAVLLCLLCILLIYLVFVVFFPIKAVPDCPDSVGEGQSFTCDGSGSKGWMIADYAWDFGDGGSGSGVTVIHTYDDGPNLYNVTLTVTDRLGQTDSQTTQVTVNNLPPVADAGGPYECQTGAQIQLSGTCTDPGLAEDELQDPSWADFSGAAISEPTFTCPNTVGEVTVTLTCTDKDGASDQDSAIVKVVEPVGLEADADGPYTGNVGEAITFDGSGSVPPDMIETYVWDLGDGSTRTGETVTYSYSTTGTYTVTLTVSMGSLETSDTTTGSLQDSDTTTATITEDGDGGEPQPPVAVCEASQIPKTNQCYRFDGSGSTDDSEIVSYDWDLGDGSTSTGEVLEYCYEEAGAYKVTLTVTDNDELTDTCTTEVTVEEE